MNTTVRNLPCSQRPAAADIRLVTLGNLPSQRYYLAARSPSEAARLVVLVHGIARNAELLIESFWTLAKDRDVILVAPFFDEEHCTDYQRLGRKGKGPRADLTLKCILSDVARVTGWGGRKAAYFGHSAGAQFVHRFMFAHPQAVACAALSAAGWYTFPNRKAFPNGIGPTRRLPDLQFEPRRFLRVPTAVFIGRDDIVRDETLNCRPSLDRQQGLTRLERARNWVAAMERSAERLKLPARVELVELDGVGHDFLQGVRDGRLNGRVMEWLLSNSGTVDQ